MLSMEMWQFIVCVLWQSWDHWNSMIYPFFSHFESLRKICRAESYFAKKPLGFWLNFEDVLLSKTSLRKTILSHFLLFFCWQSFGVVLKVSLKFGGCFKLWNVQCFGFLAMKTFVQSMTGKWSQSFLHQLKQERSGVTFEESRGLG